LKVGEKLGKVLPAAVVAGYRHWVGEAYAADFISGIDGQRAGKLLSTGIATAVWGLPNI